MADNEIIAAILASGMLPPLSPPAITPDGGIDDQDHQRLVLAMAHALGLYRSILEGLSTRAQSPIRATSFRPNHNSAQL